MSMPPRRGHARHPPEALLGRREGHTLSSWPASRTTELCKALRPSASVRHLPCRSDINLYARRVEDEAASVRCPPAASRPARERQVARGTL